jgi:hypothetical protein
MGPGRDGSQPSGFISFIGRTRRITSVLRRLTSSVAVSRVIDSGCSSIPFLSNVLPSLVVTVSRSQGQADGQGKRGDRG